MIGDSTSILSQTSSQLPPRNTGLLQAPVDIMENITEQVVHGYINFTHTSHLTPYYPPANLPTPWPLLVLSVLISLLIACFNVKAAFASLNQLTNGVCNHPRSPFSRLRTSLAPQHELESLHRPKINEEPPPYTSVNNFDNSDFAIPADDNFVPQANLEESFEATRPPPIVQPRAEEESWDTSPRRKALDITFITYSTYRAVVAFTIQLLSIIDKHTTSCAPSNLLLILVSIQILLSNVSFPRSLRLLLTIDTFLVALAFTAASYAPLNNTKSNDNYVPLAYSPSNIPWYGQLNITGGTCPVYSSNCIKQTSHWSRIGCGNHTQVIDYEDNDDENPTTGFFTPYATSGDLNTSANPLNIVEAVIFVFGTIWLLGTVWQVYEIRYIIWPRSRDRQGPKRNDCANALWGMVTLFGVIGAFVAAWMSISAHMSQALGHHHSTFLDSYGPEVNTNQTFKVYPDGFNYTLSSQYWGNSTSWSDCFVVENPTSANWWWNEWTEQNRRRLWRIPAGV